MALYTELLPGITNVTQRVRYYSFYPWLCDAYARREGRRDVRHWRRFLRRAEALLALASLAHAPETLGVAGSDWASRVLRDYRLERVTFADAAEPGADAPYLVQVNGALGAIYAGVLQLLGVVAPGEGDPIPRPGEGIGDQLAAAFTSSVGEHGRTFLDLVDRGAATLAELREVGETLSPDSIPESSDEARALRDLLFRLDPTSPGVVSSARRDALLLGLSLAAEMDGRPTADDLRWSLYSSRLPNGTPWELPAPLGRRAEAWLAFQANEIAHVALEAVLAWLVDGLSDLEPEPTSRVDAVRKCLAPALDEMGEAACWADLVSSIELPTHAMSQEPDSEWSLSTRAVGAASPERAAAGLRLLAALDRRWAGDGHPVARTFGPGTYGAQTAWTVLRFMRARAGDALDASLAELVQRLVIERHVKVALRKLHQQGKRTFVLEPIGGGLVRRGSMVPVWTSPRFFTALRALDDLHLLDHDGPTERGLARLAEVTE